MKLERKTLEVDGERLVCELSLRETNAVIIHGAGASDRRRYYSIAEELLRGGVGAVVFDFSGHGDSSGTLEDLSLSKRRRQAAAVIDGPVPEGRLYLLGFSMGAQTLCDVLPRYADRTAAVLLGCPAIYAADAHDLRFGDPDFTKRLREPKSWATSDAPKKLADFTGQTFIAIGDQDQVIPDGVVELLKKAAKRLDFREYVGADHGLAGWLTAHPSELEKLITQLLGE